MYVCTYLYFLVDIFHQFWSLQEYENINTHTRKKFKASVIIRQWDNCIIVAILKYSNKQWNKIVKEGVDSDINFAHKVYQAL